MTAVMKKNLIQMMASLAMVFFLSSGLGFAESYHQSEALQQDSYHIGVGDLLQIEVYDEEDLNKEVRVLTDGFISFPLLGSLRAEGKTVRELEKLIDSKLAERFLVNPQVSVFVKEFSNVFVFGEVQAPGSFPLYGKMTAFEAIALAGGFTEVANQSKVKVLRRTEGRELTMEIDIKRVIEKGDTSQDVELQANDKVIVPRSFF